MVHRFLSSKICLGTQKEAEPQKGEGELENTV